VPCAVIATMAVVFQGKSEVLLCKKKLEDFTQRWVVAEDG